MVAATIDQQLGLTYRCDQDAVATGCESVWIAFGPSLLNKQDSASATRSDTDELDRLQLISINVNATDYIDAVMQRATTVLVAWDVHLRDARPFSVVPLFGDGVEDVCLFHHLILTVAPGHHDSCMGDFRNGETFEHTTKVKRSMIAMLRKKADKSIDAGHLDTLVARVESEQYLAGLDSFHLHLTVMDDILTSLAEQLAVH